MIKSMLLFLGCMALIILWYISPIMKAFPQLTGSFQVGTEMLYFIDQDRNELFSQEMDDKRIIVSHAFYPIDEISSLKKAQYLGDKIRYFQKIVSDFYHIPQWLTKLFFRNIITKAYSHGLISRSKNRYPVVLFSHGLLGLPSDMYTVILEDLASHGYIVIGIDHPYFNLLTLSPQDKILSSSELSKQFEEMSPKEQKEFQTNAIKIYKSDIKFVLDELEQIDKDKNSQFYKRLDLENICIIGHSAGGTAAIEACRDDKRCTAAIDLDGWYDQAIGYEPLSQPLLLLFGSKSVEVNEPTLDYLKRKRLTREQYYEREEKIQKHREALCSVPQCSFQILPDISHGDFGDGVLLKWPLRSWHEPDSYKTISLINKTILEFLDKNVKNRQIKKLG